MIEAMDSNDTLREPEVTGDFRNGTIPVPITGIKGTLKFTYDGKTVTIKGDISNVPQGQHGFHIHTSPFTGHKCRESGPHYNPHNVRAHSSQLFYHHGCIYARKLFPIVENKPLSVHFPLQKSHGRPEDTERHVGDLGNIHSSDSWGITKVNVQDSIINLKDGDVNSILNRTVVIHQLPDFFNSSSIGPRIACGIIMKGK